MSKSNSSSHLKHLLEHIYVTLIAFILMGIVAFITIVLKPFDPIERAIRDFSFTDIYYEIMQETSTAEESQLVTIVDLKNQTNRSDIAQTIMDIESCGPKVLGIDCTFDVEGETYAANDSLIQIAESNDNIVFAQKCSNWQNDSIGWTSTSGSFFNQYSDIIEGTVNMPRAKYDNMKRRFSTGEKVNGHAIPSFLTQIERVFTGKIDSLVRCSDIMINYSPTSFTILQPEQVKDSPELIQNRIVLYGSVDLNEDMHWTPSGKISGVELIAYGAETLINKKEVKEIALFPSCLVSLIIVFLTQLLQVTFLKKTKQSKYPFVKHIIGSSYVLGLLSFLFIALFVGIGFILFKYYNLSFNLAWAMSVVAFLGSSRSLYKSFKGYIQEVSEKRKYLKAISDKLD